MGVPIGHQAQVETHEESGFQTPPLVRALESVDRATEVLYVVMIAVLATVMLVGVVFRYVLNSSLSWSDELAMMLFTWAAFLAIASGYRHDKHVNIDIVIRSLPEAWCGRAALLAEGLAGAYLLCFLVSGVQALPLALRGHTEALQWPLAVPYLAIPTSCVLMILHWIRKNALEGNRADIAVKVIIVLGFFGAVYLPITQELHLMGTSRLLAISLSLFVPMLVGVPVAFALGLAATTYISILGTIPFSTGAYQTFYGINILTLMAIPLLILSGKLMHEAGIAERLVDFAQALVGRVRGGLGVANVFASFMFGDISGSAVSDTAAIGSLMIPEMKRRGYGAGFCAALQGAAGTLGMTAPLSITILCYAAATSVSVSRLATAVIVPGALLAASFILIALVQGRLRGYPSERVPAKVLLPRTLQALPGMSALALILLGILGGVITPAEIGSVLLLYILVLTIFLYRRGEPRRLYSATVSAGHVSGMTLLMLATASFLGFVLTHDLVGMLIVDTISQFVSNKYVVIFVVNMVFIVLGMVLEGPALTFGLLPTFLPLLSSFGIDPIHWGVLFVINLGLGMVVPPVALNLFISTEIAGARYEDAIRESVPFISIMALNMVLIAVYPQVALLVPHIVFGYPLP